MTVKICILTTSFPLRKGDLSGIFVFEQTRLLCESGVQVHVVAPHHKGAPLHEDDTGVRVSRFRYFLPERMQKLCYGSGIPNNLKENILARLQLPLLMFVFTIQAIRYAKGCNLIHAHWSIAGLAGLIASKILGIPIILNMHHGTTRTLSHLEKVILEQVDYVICNSSFTLSHIIKASKPKETSVVPPGVDTDRFQPQMKNAAGGIPLPGIATGIPIIFTLGRLIELKGHTHLIEAVSLLSEDLKFHLLIGGEGSLRRELEDQVREKGLSDKVTFLGHISHDLAPVYYTVADIYVQPSIIDRDGNTEGLGVALLEAMVCETACVGSRVGGITDIIHDGETGFLVDPANPTLLADRISILLKNKELRMQMGKEGRRYVEQRYSWRTLTKEVIEVYTRLVNRKKLNS